jgi:hypothetical protein
MKELEKAQIRRYSKRNFGLVRLFALSTDASFIIFLNFFRRCINSVLDDSVQITNKTQPCNTIYYSTVHWRLNMFRAEYRSLSGALTVFAASGLLTHVVTGRSKVWLGTQFISASLVKPSWLSPFCTVFFWCSYKRVFLWPVWRL